MTLDQFVARSLPDARVEVTYTRNRCILINCIRYRHRVVLRIHQVFRRAPRPVAKAVVGLYLKQPRESTTRRNFHTIINEFIDSQEARILRSWAHTVDLARYPGPHGSHHDLQEMYDSLNEAYFEGRLAAFVTWSRTTPRRSMGTWLETPPRFKNIITINRLLDSPRVPRYVVEEVLHHEMLHEAIPAVRKNGRKYMHTPDFRRREREFPHYERANDWVRDHWDRLCRASRRRSARRRRSR
jgi:hypothetical protein